MLVNAAPLIKESSGQQTWIDLALPDLRTLARELRSAAIDEVKRADDAQGALRILLAHFGFIDEALLAVTILTPDRKRCGHEGQTRPHRRKTR